MAGDVSAFSPFYWREFFADTAHLDHAEGGAYLHLLGHLWIQGGALPYDLEKLRKLAKVTDRAAWPAVWDAIAGFFQVADGMVTQKRTTMELHRARQRYQAQLAKTEAARQALAAKRAATRPPGGSGSTPPPAPPPSAEPPNRSVTATVTETVTNNVTVTVTASKPEPEPEPEPITTTTSCPDSGERDATRAPDSGGVRPVAEGSALRVKPLKAVNQPSFDAQDVMHHIRRLALSLTPNQPEFSDRRWAKTLASGALEIDRLVRLDGATWPEVRSTVSWLIHEPPNANGFRWAAQVRSGAALRRHWSKIRVAMAQASRPPTRPTTGPASFARGQVEPPDYQARAAERRQLEEHQAREAAAAVAPPPDIRDRIRAITGGKP